MREADSQFDRTTSSLVQRYSRLLVSRRLFFIFLLPSAFCPAFAAYQEYQLAGSIAASPGYSFGTGQYRLYAREALLKNDFVGFEYDIDSFYADYAYALSPYFRSGVSGKIHIFDYQNLNHIVDPTTGAETKALALNAPFYRAQFYLEGRYRTLAIRYAAGVQKYDLTRRETADTTVSTNSPGWALVQQFTLGYWNLNQIKPYAFTGIAAFLSVESQQLASPYIWRQGGVPLTTSREQIFIHEIHMRAGIEYADGALKLMAATRAGATNFSLPGEAQDLIQSFSVGGPENRYRRVAGFSFSEFRVPAFGLINLDAVIRAVGPVSFWFIADTVLFDRPARAPQIGNQQDISVDNRFHAGAGAGLIVDLPDGILGNRSAFFIRGEIPFFAAGQNRFQIFLGLNGQIF